MYGETKACLSLFQTSMNAKSILATAASRLATIHLAAIGASVKKVTGIWIPSSV